ncbi:MAG: antibiotic biosynthesis monooxygenase [Spirochaetes bacterium]|nr:antibiotic biosynthesis monooxygenase [Spirochaetota bacterium]
MYVVCVTSKVKPEFVEAYVAASLENARATRQEPGNLRFDVLRGCDQKDLVFFYEVYRRKEDFAAHQQNPHYFKWKEAVKDYLAEPRVGVKYENVFPADDGLWAAT